MCLASIHAFITMFLTLNICFLGMQRESLIQTAVQRTSALQLPYLSWLSLVNQAAHSSGKPPAHHLQVCDRILLAFTADQYI